MTTPTAASELNPDALVSLYVLDTRPAGGGSVLRFTSSADGQNPIMFGGHEFTPVDISVSGFNWDGRGAFPRPTIQLANVGGIVTAAIITLGDLVGSHFYRYRTFARHLDNGADPDTSATFPVEVYTVDQKSKQTKLFVEWKLASIVDQVAVKIPRRQCIRDVCTRVYRGYDPVTEDFTYAGTTCPYAGEAYFGEDGEPTLLKSEDKCGRRVVDCKARFGADQSLPTNAFPGISRIRLS